MRRVLYLGLDPSRFKTEGDLFHFPIIRIEPRPFSNPEIQAAFQAWDSFTHLVFTSRVATNLCLNYCKQIKKDFQEKKVLAIGKATASLLQKVDGIAEQETAEGMIDLLRSFPEVKRGHVFFPHSVLSRSVIVDYLRSQDILFTASCLYDTVVNRKYPLPALESFEEIIFTSPSTVGAFLELYGHLPTDKILTCIGPITQSTLDRV